MKLEKTVQQQNNQISGLEKANKELKQMLDQIQEETQRSRSQGNEELQVREKVRELEAKLGQLETQIQKKQEKGSEDTFSRGSEPDILLSLRQPEKAILPPPAQPEEHPSASILDDPSIKEMYERRRQLFQRKLNPPSNPETKQAS
jgi:hypothetical protein